MTSFSFEPLPFRIELNLTVSDIDYVRDLVAIAEGRDRDRYANAALHIGLGALRNARSVIDEDILGCERARFASELRHALDRSARQSNADFARLLSTYFDPNKGALTAALDRFVTALEAHGRDSRVSATK